MILQRPSRPFGSVAEFSTQLREGAARADGQALYFSRAARALAARWPRRKGGRRALPVRGGMLASTPIRVRGLLQLLPGRRPRSKSAKGLEQLRALEHGMRIHLVALSEAPPAGVDTPEDLERVRAGLAVRDGLTARVTTRVLFVCLGNICRSPT